MSTQQASNPNDTQAVAERFGDNFQKCLEKLQPLLAEIHQRMVQEDEWLLEDVRHDYISLQNDIEHYRDLFSRPSKRMTEFITREGRSQVKVMEGTMMFLRGKLVGQETMRRQLMSKDPSLLKGQVNIAKQVARMASRVLQPDDPAQGSTGLYQLPGVYVVRDGKGREIRVTADLTVTEDSGGYGIIILGYDDNDNCIALKRVKESEIHPEEHRHFKREAQLWGSLSHRNILPYYGMFTHGNHMYLASPWMSRGTLAKLVAADTQHRISRFDLLLQLAKVLAFMHEKGLIHGDIKGDNVLVDYGDQIKICDFGLTKYIGGYTSAPLIGAGSAAWKCPERWGASPSTRSPKTDVFSFGMTIAEILTGAPPFSPHKGDTVRDKILAGHRPECKPPSTPDGKTSFEVLWALATRCWAADPDDRPTMAQAVVTIASKKVDWPARPGSKAASKSRGSSFLGRFGKNT